MAEGVSFACSVYLHVSYFRQDLLRRSFPQLFSKYSPEATSMSYFRVADILKYKGTTASQTEAARLSESDWKGNWCLEKKIGHTVNASVECKRCQVSQHIYKYVCDIICSCMFFISMISWMHDTYCLQLLTFAIKKQVVPQGSHITLYIIPRLKIGGNEKKMNRNSNLSLKSMYSFKYREKLTSEHLKLSKTVFFSRPGVRCF